MGNRKLIYLVLILTFIGVAGGGVIFWNSQESDSKEEVRSFEECASAGYPILESYPARCETAEGKTFVENIGNELEKIDIIRINTPRPNQAINSPLMIQGEARGTWFFEGDFPVKLLDEKGNIVGTAVAQAQSEWMTEDFVPFRVRLEFTMPTTNRGTLILEKDNPSGLPENADDLHIPIVFQNEGL